MNSHNGSQALTRSEGKKFTATTSTYLDLIIPALGSTQNFACFLTGLWV